MQVTEERIHIDSRWFSPERDIVRSKGLHLSNVIDFIEFKEGKQAARPIGGKLSDAGNAYASQGFLWETVLEQLIERSPTELWEWMFGRALSEPDNPLVVRPGEICLDGIYMTPDGYNIETEQLEEWKWTTKSSNWPITHEKFRRWICFQIPSYLKALNLLVCRLRVCYARGDYKSGEPIWMEYILTYSQQEIDETWDMIRVNAEVMRREGLC